MNLTILGKIGSVVAVVGLGIFFYGAGRLGVGSAMTAVSGLFLVPIGLLVAVAAGRRRWLRILAGLLVIALSMLTMIANVVVGLVGIGLAWLLMRRDAGLGEAAPIADERRYMKLSPSPVGHKTQKVKVNRVSNLRFVLVGFGVFVGCGVIISVLTNPNVVAEIRGTQTARAVRQATFTPIGGDRRATTTVRFVTATAVGDAQPVLPPATVENASVEVIWELLPGVVDVGLVSQHSADSLYGEVMVEAGFVNDSTAGVLRREAGQFLGVSGGLREFSVILDDGEVAADYIWEPDTRTFRETRLTMVVRDADVTATPSRERSTFVMLTSTLAPTLTRVVSNTPVILTPTLAPTLTPAATNTRQASRTPTLTRTPTAVSIAGETYTVLNFANVRSCTSTDCQIVVGLAGGTQLTVTGSENGMSVGGSTRWYAVRLKDGRTGYVHSSLVGAGVIAVAPTVAPAGGGNTSQAAPNTSVPPAGPTSFVCPRNCDGAIAMGLSPQQAATCPGLDRDKDGVACYGD